MEKIAERFKEIREKLGYSQGEFAKLFGLSQDTISAIERNIQKPNFKVLTSLCLTYKVNLNWLFTGQGNPLIDAPLHSGDKQDKNNLKTEMEKLKERVEKLEQNVFHTIPDE